MTTTAALPALRTEADVLTWVQAFYHRIRHDPVLRGVFLPTAPARPQWWRSTVAFWHTVLLLPHYEGRAFPRRPPLPQQGELFDHWRQAFLTAMDEHFGGLDTAEIKARVLNLATMLQHQALALSR